MELPKSKLPPSRKNPSRLIIYSVPKLGKTTIVSKLDNCLIIELEEGGADYVEALKIEAYNLAKLAEIGTQIKNEGKPYKYVCIDTITKLEELCEAVATNNYKKSPMGVNFQGKSVLSLPQGAGYFWLREAFTQWLNFCYSLADNVILLGHIKDKFIEVKGKEVSAKDLDLTGKLRTITCANADAIGYMYRNKEGQTLLNFKTSEEVTCGSRCEHLRGQEIVIADTVPDSDPIEIIAHWDKIYLPTIN